MKNNYSAGDYIEAWCTKCRMELGHTIIAMVDNAPRQVQCNTCNGKHNYRAKPSVRSSTAVRKGVRRIRSREAVYEESLARLTGGDLSHARKYTIRGNFEKDEVVDHSKFGIGIVLSVIHSNKIEMLFKDGPRLLVQNKEL